MIGRRSKLLVTLTCTLAIVAAMSGTAAGGTHRTVNAAACSSPGISGNTIKIGVLYEGSGAQAATFADTIKGLKARLAKLKDDGGPNIDYVVADDGATDATNLTAAKRLVEEDKVFLVFEITSHSKGSAAYLHAHGIPVVGWAIDPVWGIDNNMFGYRNSFSPNPNAETSTTPNVLKKLGAHRIAVLGFNNSASEGFVRTTAGSIQKSGLKVAYKVIVPAGSKEFTAVVQKIKDSKADGIATGMDFYQNDALLKAVIQAGIRNQFKAVVFPFGYDSRVPPAFPSLDGGYVGIDFKPYEDNLPGHQAFKKYYAQENGADAVASQISMVSWLSAEAMIKGFQVAGSCPTRANFIKKLRNVKGFDAGGLIQPVDFKKAFGKPILCEYFVQMQGKVWVPGFNGNLVCGKQLS